MREMAAVRCPRRPKAENREGDLANFDWLPAFKIDGG